MTIAKYKEVIFSEEQLESAARFLSKQKGMTYGEAKDQIIDLATHHITHDTHWRQGLWFIFVVYHGNTQKIAEICIDATKVY